MFFKFFFFTIWWPKCQVYNYNFRSFSSVFLLDKKIQQHLNLFTNLFSHKSRYTLIYWRFCSINFAASIESGLIKVPDDKTFWFSLACFPLHEKIKFPIKEFFSKCDQIGRKLQIWSYLLKKSLKENFIFCAVFLQFQFYLLVATIWYNSM